MSTSPTLASSPVSSRADQDMVWQRRTFHELQALELEALWRLRSEVFVVEQQCVFLDIDGWDAQASHLLAWAQAAPGQAAVLCACARLFAPGVKGEEASIGRVITAPAWRGLGLGRELMRRALEAVERQHPGAAVRISAQSRLLAFYESLGFAPLGPAYLEDGIWHTDMRLRLQGTSRTSASTISP